MSRVWICIAAVLSAACINPPKIVAIDRASALEQQAGASFPEVERKLTRAAAVATPVPLTPDQLDTIRSSEGPIVDEHDLTDAERIDDWLERHCVGEGNDGLLADTSSACHGAVDHDELVKLVDRTNRSRAQLWVWMHDKQPDVSMEELRRRWRAKHASGVTCGAWVQSEDGKWTSKAC
jgi:hypothetical protein